MTAPLHPVKVRAALDVASLSLLQVVLVRAWSRAEEAAGLMQGVAIGIERAYLRLLDIEFDEASTDAAAEGYEGRAAYLHDIACLIRELPQ